MTKEQVKQYLHGEGHQMVYTTDDVLRVLDMVDVPHACSKSIKERAAIYALEEDDGWPVKDTIKEQAYIAGAEDQRIIDEAKMELKS